MAKMTIYILPTKTRGCAPQSPETDENDENGGCPSDKTRVCQEQGFRHPDSTGKKKRFGVYQKACFQGKKKDNTHAPKSLQGVCGGPYRFWPPTQVPTPPALNTPGPPPPYNIDHPHPLVSNTVALGPIFWTPLE